MKNVMKKVFSLFLVGVVTVSMFGFIAPTRAEAVEDENLTYNNGSYIDFTYPKNDLDNCNVLADFWDSDYNHKGSANQIITKEGGKISIKIPDETKYVGVSVYNGEKEYTSTQNFLIIDESKESRPTLRLRCNTKERGKLGYIKKKLINCVNFTPKEGGVLILKYPNLPTPIDSDDSDDMTVSVDVAFRDAVKGDTIGYNPISLDERDFESGYAFVSIPGNTKLISISSSVKDSLSIPGIYLYTEDSLSQADCIEINVDINDPSLYFFETRSKAYWESVRHETSWEKDPFLNY